MAQKFTLFIAIITTLLFTSSTMKVKVALDNPDKKIYASTQINNIKQLKLMVDGNGHYIYPEQGNIFTIPTLSKGDHNIEVISDDFLFPVLRLKKTAQGVPKMIWLNPLDRKYIKTVSEPTIIPLQKIKYFEPESSFNVVAFLTSGSGLFIVMGVFMVFCYKGLGKLTQAQMAPSPQQPRRQQ